MSPDLFPELGRPPGAARRRSPGPASVKRTTQMNRQDPSYIPPQGRERVAELIVSALSHLTSGSPAAAAPTLMRALAALDRRPSGSPSVRHHLDEAKLILDAALAKSQRQRRNAEERVGVDR